MSGVQKSLPLSLQTPINLQNAPASGLNALFLLEPDASDVRRYRNAQFAEKREELDDFFSLDRGAPDYQELKGRALIAHRYGNCPEDLDPWEFISELLAPQLIPGFSTVRRGRPIEWTPDRLICLYFDVKAAKRKFPNHTIEHLLKRLRSTRNSPWLKYELPALRKAYSQAARLARRFPVPTKANPRAIEHQDKRDGLAQPKFEV